MSAENRTVWISKAFLEQGITRDSPLFKKGMEELSNNENITSETIAHECVKGYLSAQGVSPQSTPKWLVLFVGGSMVVLLVSCVVLAIVAIIKSKQQPSYEPAPAIAIEEATAIPTATITVIPENVRLARDWNDYVNRIGENDPRSVFDGTTRLKPSKILTNPSVRGFAAIIEDPRTTGAIAREAAVFLGSIMTKTLGINEGELQMTPQKFVSRINWSSLPPSPAPVTFPTEPPSATQSVAPKGTNRGGQEQATAVPTKTNTPTATPTSTATTTVTVTPTAPLGLGLAKTTPTPTKTRAAATATRIPLPPLVKTPAPVPTPTVTATPTKEPPLATNIGEAAGEEGENWVKKNLWDPFQSWVTAPLTPSPTVTSPPTPRSNPTSTPTPQPTEETTPDCADWRTNGGEEPCER